MNKPIMVKVSSRNQIAVPAIARERLKIHSGDILLVDVQDGMVILTPKPSNYTRHLAGLHREVWEAVNTKEYLIEERKKWEG